MPALRCVASQDARLTGWTALTQPRHRIRHDTALTQPQSLTPLDTAFSTASYPQMLKQHCNNACIAVVSWVVKF
jgi:hypothetical protein